MFAKLTREKGYVCVAIIIVLFLSHQVTAEDRTLNIRHAVAGKAIDKTPLARAAYSSLNQFGEYAIADLTRRYSALRTAMDPDKNK